jgi:hypothetical protein
MNTDSYDLTISLRFSYINPRSLHAITTFGHLSLLDASSFNIIYDYSIYLPCTVSLFLPLVQLIKHMS